MYRACQRPLPGLRLGDVGYRMDSCREVFQRVWSGFLASMCGFVASTGHTLRRVALRYRQPIYASGRRLTARTWGRPLLPPGEPTDRVAPADGPTARSAALARLEAVLFLAREPQASRKLAQLAGLADGTKTRTLVRALNRLYDAEGSAFRVEEVAGGFQLMSRPKFAPWLGRLHPVPLEVRLSAPAMETLAVVAYRQPVLRADVEAVRGVQSGEILRQLIERDLVRIAGRSEELGRPFLYGTTKLFLQIFGLRRPDELPQANLLRAVKPGSEDVDPELAEADKETSHQTSYSHEAEEETNVKTSTTTRAVLEEHNHDTATATKRPIRNEQPDDELPFEDDLDEDYDDDDDDDDDDDEDEDEQDDSGDDEDELEDEPWEEVEDGEDEEEDDDEEWDEDDEWDEDEWDDEEDE